MDAFIGQHFIPVHFQVNKVTFEFYFTTRLLTYSSSTYLRKSYDAFLMSGILLNGLVISNAFKSEFFIKLCCLGQRCHTIILVSLLKTTLLIALEFRIFSTNIQMVIHAQ